MALLADVLLAATALAAPVILTPASALVMVILLPLSLVFTLPLGFVPAVPLAVPPASDAVAVSALAMGPAPPSVMVAVPVTPEGFVVVPEM